MRKSVILAVSFILAGAVATAQMKVQPQPKTTRRGSPLVVAGAGAKTVTSFPRISREDALKMHREGKAVFIDVRANEEFLHGHIRGALSIPGSQLVRRFVEVPPRRTVIAYCACSAEQSSGRAVQDLMAHGVKNVYALKGGWNEWKANRLPIAAGPK